MTPRIVSRTTTPLREKNSNRSAVVRGPGGRGAAWVGRASAVALVAGVAACGGGVTPGYAEADDTLRETSIVLRDGRTVVCVVYSSGRKGGLSCDWTGYGR